MKYLKLELSDKIYQSLKTKFKGDEKSICDFVVKALTDELTKNFTDNSKAVSDKNIEDLKDYVVLNCVIKLIRNHTYR